MMGHRGGCHRRRKDEGDTRQPSDRNLHVNRSQRREPQRPLAVGRQRNGACGIVRVGDTPGQFVPAEAATGERAVVEAHLQRNVDGQQAAEVLRQRGHHVGSEPMLGIAPRNQADSAARRAFEHGDRRVVVSQLRQLVAPIGEPAPPDRGRTLPLGARACAPGHEVDLIGDHERGQQADAELSQELFAPPAQIGVTLGRAADRGEQLTGVGGGQPDAGVADLQPAAGEGTQVDALGRTLSQGAACRDRVNPVLQQFAQIDARAGVQVPGQQIDDAAQINLEGLSAHSPWP